MGIWRKLGVTPRLIRHVWPGLPCSNLGSTRAANPSSKLGRTYSGSAQETPIFWASDKPL
eukprot:356577-Pelagomonas_calceolata.AAC.3